MAWWLVAVALASEPTVVVEGREVAFERSAASVVEDAAGALEERRFDDASRLFRALAEAGGGADARWLEGIAAYESGDRRRAERAVEEGLRLAPDHVALLVLRGLVDADAGRGEAALAVLRRAERLAREAGDAGLEGRAVLNRGLVHLDRGEAREAEALFTRARELGERAGDDALVALAGADLGLARALRGQPAPDDGLGRVSEALRRGDVERAREAIPVADPTDRRAQVRRGLATASVARARGELDEAARELLTALASAREGGLVRESAAALAELGLVHRLAGRYAAAGASLDEAIGLVAGTSFRVQELLYRIEAGRVALRAGELDRARRQVEAARALAPGVEDPTVPPQLDELDGWLAERSGRADDALAALERAYTVNAAAGWWADAARVATLAVEVQAGRDEATKRWTTRAVKAFDSAGDPVGAAHVALAEGLGHARRKDLEAALGAFQRAAAAGEGAGTGRGEQVATIARANAAQALVVLGHSEDALAEAERYGISDALARHHAFQDAETHYRDGLIAYDAGRYDTARERFHEAFEGFRALREEAYATTARRGRAWATWNRAVGLKPEQAYPFYAELVQEAVQVDDPELEARARAAQALAAAAIGQPNVGTLRKAADHAEQMGLTDVATSVWAELAAREGELVDRARAARRAFTLAEPDDPAGAYAMYSVAVDAYNVDQPELALQLAEEVLPSAGSLADPVRAVIEASRGALEE